MAFNNPTQIYNEFEWYYKNEFQWIYINHNKESQRTVFLGSNDNLNYATILKYIKIYVTNYKNLLKEAYLLACVKNNRYFTEIVDLFTSDNCENMYIIMRDNGVDLKDFIKYYNYDYNKKFENISRFIVFQTVCGLSILHDKGLSHNDIKLSNIVVSEAIKTKICNLCSASKNKTIIGSGTNGYLSPQAILGSTRCKEDDMYAIGIIFLELLNRETGKFKLTEKNDNEKKVKELLQKFYDIKEKGDWNVDINYNKIVGFIESGLYNKFESRLKPNLFNANEDEDNKKLIQNLLEINPKKRWTSNQVINLEMFTNLNFTFEKDNNDMKYKEENYLKYLNSTTDGFKKNIEEIREKFIGETLVRIKLE